MANVVDWQADTGFSIKVMDPGTRVEVRSKFEDAWASGFEIIEHTGAGYRVRRVSDGAELPVLFDDDEIREERRRKRAMWWY